MPADNPPSEFGPESREEFSDMDLWANINMNTRKIAPPAVGSHYTLRLKQWQVAVAAKFLLKLFRGDKSTIMVCLRFLALRLAFFDAIVDKLPMTWLDVFGIPPLPEDCFVLAFPAKCFSCLSSERRQMITT